MKCAILWIVYLTTVIGQDVSFPGSTNLKINDSGKLDNVNKNDSNNHKVKYLHIMELLNPALVEQNKDNDKQKENKKLGEKNSTEKQTEETEKQPENLSLGEQRTTEKQILPTKTPWNLSTPPNDQQVSANSKNEVRRKPSVSSQRIRTTVIDEDESFLFPVDEFQTKPKVTFTRTTTDSSVTERKTQTPLKPVKNLEKCPGNQYYYPGEPWFCDCGPKYIYYKPKNDCFLAYMKGPCKKEQYLIVNSNKEVVCSRNPCKDGLVFYQGKCYEFPKSGGPCQPIKNVTTVLDINPSTLNIECIPITENRVTLISFPDKCPPGSKRDAHNKCRENWNVL